MMKLDAATARCVRNMLSMERWEGTWYTALPGGLQIVVYRKRQLHEKPYAVNVWKGNRCIRHLSVSRYSTLATALEGARLLKLELLDDAA